MQTSKIRHLHLLQKYEWYWIGQLQGILLAWRAAAAVAMGGALYFSKRSSVIEEADDDEDDR